MFPPHVGEEVVVYWGLLCYTGST